MQRYPDGKYKSMLTLALVATLIGSFASIPLALAQDRLRSDPRAATPGLPHTIEELRERFYPEYVESVYADEVVVAGESPKSITVPTEIGRCYALLAVAPAEEDIDLWVREAGEVKAITLSRDSYPVVDWCAAQRTADIVVTADRRQVDVSLAVIRDSNTDTIPRDVAPGGELNARMLSYWSRVAPRWSSQAPPTTLNFERPHLFPVAFRPGDESCALILAVAQGQIEDVDLLIRDGRESIAGSYDVGDESALLFCGDWHDGYELVVGVRRGTGRVRVIVLYPWQDSVSQ